MKYKKFQHKVTEEGLPQGPNFRRTNQSISTFGYSDFSPYRNEPYLDIFSPNGVIDMSNTGIPLLANGGYLAPYSGLHQFDTPWIREIPLMNEGGDKPRSSKIKDFIMGMKLKSRNVSKPYLGQEAFTALQTLPDYGFSDEAVLTSMLRGKEDWGAVGGAGSKSLHNVGRAFDVSAREDSEDFIRFINSPQGQKWMSDYHIDYLDETDKVYQGKAMPHHHFEFEKKFPKIRRGLKKSGVLSKDRLRELESEYKAYGDPKRGGLVEVSNYPGYQSDELPELVISPKAKPVDLTYIPEAESTYQINPEVQSYLDNRDFFKREGGLVKAKDGKEVRNKTYRDMGWFIDPEVWDEKSIKKYSVRPYLKGDEFMPDWGKKGKIKVSTEGGVGAGVLSKLPEDFDVSKPPKTLLDAYHMALAAGAETDAEARVMAAQWAVESGGGKSKSARDHFAYFGIKGDDFSMGTHEVRDGKLTSEKAGWEGYSSPLQGFKARVAFTNKAKGRYRTRGYGKDKSDLELVNILSQAGYATSPTYAANLKRQLAELAYEADPTNYDLYEKVSNEIDKSETDAGGEDMSQYIKLLQGYLARGKKGEGSKTGVNPEQLKMMQQMMQMAQQQPGMMQQLGMTQAPRMPRITADEFKYKRRPRKTKIKAKNISVMKKGGSFNLHNSAKNSKLYNMGGNIQNQSTDDINSQRNSKFVEYLTSTSDAYKMDQMMKMMQESGITPNMLPIPQMNLGGMSSSDLVDMQNKDIQNRMDLFQSGMNMLDNPFDLVYDEDKSKIGRQKSLDKVLGTKWYEFGEKAKRNKAAREGATEMYKAQGYLDPKTRRTFAGRMLHPFQPYRDTGYRDVKQNLGVQDFLEMNKQAILGVDKYGNPIGSNAYVGGFERAFPYLQTRRLGGSGLKRYQDAGSVLGQTSDEMLLDILNRYLSDAEVNKINEVLTSTGVGEDVESKLASPAFQKAYKNAILKLSKNKDAKAELDAYTNMMSRAINLGYDPQGRATPLSGRFLFDSGTVRNPAYEDYIMKERLAQNNPELLAYIESLNPGFLDDRYLTDQVSFEELLGGRNFKSLPPNQQLALIENFRRGVIGPDVDENLYLGDLAAPELTASHLRPTGHPNQTIQEFTLPADGSMITGTGAGSGYQGRPIHPLDEINEVSVRFGLPRVLDARLRGQQAATSPVVDNVDDVNDVDDTDNGGDQGGGDDNVIVDDGGDDNVVVDDKDEKDETVVDTSGQTTPQGYWGMAPFLHAHDFQNKVKRGLFGNTKNKFKAKGLSVGFTPYYTGAMDGSQPIAPRPILPYEIVAPGTTGVVDPRNVDPRLIDRVRDKASDIVDNVRDRSDRGRRRERRINDKLAQYSAVDPTPTSTPDELRDVLKREKWLNKQERFSDREDRRNEREQRRQLNQRERELNKQDRMAKRDARQSERLRRRISRQYEQGGAFGHINTAAYGMGGDYNLPIAQLGRGMFSRDKENIFADLNENPGMYLNTRIQPTQGSTYSNFDNFQTERRFGDKLYDLFHPNTRRVAMTPGGFRDGGPLRKYQRKGEVKGTPLGSEVSLGRAFGLPNQYFDRFNDLGLREEQFADVTGIYNNEGAPLGTRTIYSLDNNQVYSAPPTEESKADAEESIAYAEEEKRRLEEDTLNTMLENAQAEKGYRNYLQTFLYNSDEDIKNWSEAYDKNYDYLQKVSPRLKDRFNNMTVETDKYPYIRFKNKYGGLRKYQDEGEVVYPTMRATPPVPYKPEMINGSPMLGPIVDLAAAVDGRVGIPYNAGWSNPKELDPEVIDWANTKELTPEVINWAKEAGAREQYKLGQEVYLDGGQIQDMINKGYKIQYF